MNVQAVSSLIEKYIEAKDLKVRFNSSFSDHYAQMFSEISKSNFNFL